MYGSAARMRATPLTWRVVWPGCTLKSRGMKSRFWAISSCSMDRIIPGQPLQLAADEEGHVDHPVREAPLVVVPGEHLDELAVVRQRGLRGIEDGRCRVAVVVDRDGRLGVVLEDALQLPLGGGFAGSFALLHRGLPRDLRREIDQRDVRRPHPDRGAVHPPLH